MPESAKAYALSTDKNDTYNATELDLNERDGLGDRIIYVTNNKDEIIYVIDVDASFTGKSAEDKAALRVLGELYDTIVKDAIPANTLYETAEELYKAAATKVDDSKPLTVDEITKVSKAIEDALAADNLGNLSGSEYADLLTWKSTVAGWNAAADGAATFTALGGASLNADSTVLTVPYGKLAGITAVADLNTYIKVNLDAGCTQKSYNYDADTATYTTVIAGANNGAETTYTIQIVEAEVAATTVATIGGTEYTSLADAVTNAKTDDVIVLRKDVTLNTQISIPAGVTLDGKGNTITSTVDTTSTSAIVLATNCVLKDVNVESFATAEGWNGNYGVQAYKATGVEIENVAISGFDAAICVNGSEVTLKGTVTVSDNEFGGIEVSQGSGVTEKAVLTIDADATLVHAESGTVTTVWVCYGTTTSKAARVRLWTTPRSGPSRVYHQDQQRR